MCRSLPHTLPVAAVVSRPAKGLRAQATKMKSMVQVTSQARAAAGTGGQRQEEEQAGADAAAYSPLAKGVSLHDKPGKENTATRNYSRIVTSLCNTRAL